MRPRRAAEIPGRVSGSVERLAVSEIEVQEHLNGDGTSVLVLQAPLS